MENERRRARAFRAIGAVLRARSDSPIYLPPSDESSNVRGDCEPEMDQEPDTKLVSCPCCGSLDVTYLGASKGWLCEGCASFLTIAGVQALANGEHAIGPLDAL